MPKGFNERERELIRSRLIEKGSELFETYGIRKTNVEDLTRAAGISKGAFYIFYKSKEELFMEVMNRFETAFRQRIFENIRRPGFTPKENFKFLLREAFTLWRTHPLLRHFNQEDYNYLLMRLPEGAVQEHFQDDQAAIAELLERWKADGVELAVDAGQVADLMKGLFFISLHETEFGPGYSKTLETYIDLVSDFLFQE